MLIETVVAISLLMLALPAALTVASKSISLATYSRDQITAIYLAQEGIEIIRNLRDQNMLKIVGGTVESKKWTEGFFGGGSCNAGANGCRVDYGVGTIYPRIERCTGASCSFVLNKSISGPYTGTYSHTVGTDWVPTPFSRFVRTSNVPGTSDEIQVVSTVTYKSRGIAKTVVLSENLTKWLQ